MPKKKERRPRLGGPKERQVFVGGNYDFMPILHFIADCVDACPTAQEPFIGVLPFEYEEIPVERTLEEDIQDLLECRHAIFDVSDLGGQLPEMWEAKRNLDKKNIIIVYPVRKRRNVPRRGRRTILSFGLHHFGYTTLDELRTVVWRFLRKSTGEKTHYPPRRIHDFKLMRKVWNIHFLAEENPVRAQKVCEDLLDREYKSSLDLKLQLAFTGFLNNNMGVCDQALKDARSVSRGNEEEAEVLYYEAVIERLKPAPDWDNARQCLQKANELMPGDARILQLLALVLYHLKDLDGAIRYARDALDDDDAHDPIVIIKTMSDLSGYLLERAGDRATEDPADENLRESLEYTEDLPGYHELFTPYNGMWLFKRGAALLCEARALKKKARDRADIDESSERALKALELLQAASNLKCPVSERC
jgi:Flp pilus assembly protein TadD